MDDVPATDKGGSYRERWTGIDKVRLEAVDAIEDG